MNKPNFRDAQERVVAHVLRGDDDSVIVSTDGNVVSVWAAPTGDGQPEGITFDVTLAQAIARCLLAAASPRVPQPRRGRPVRHE